MNLQMLKAGKGLQVHMNESSVGCHFSPELPKQLWKDWHCKETDSSSVRHNLHSSKTLKYYNCNNNALALLVKPFSNQKFTKRIIRALFLITTPSGQWGLWRCHITEQVCRTYTDQYYVLCNSI